VNALDRERPHHRPPFDGGGYDHPGRGERPMVTGRASFNTRARFPVAVRGSTWPPRLGVSISVQLESLGWQRETPRPWK
jgi:hypothetical protein